jgi:glycosyltransferase involved in cell wall biosynthesis
LRIAIFTESLPPLTDGVARTYTRLAETLNEDGHEFLFICPMTPAEAEPWRGRVIQVYSVPFPLYKYYRVGLPNPFKLDPILDRFQPDLIQVAAPTPLCLYGQNYANRRKIPTIASYHTHFVDYFPYYGYAWAIGLGWQWMKWCYNRSRLTFVPTPGAIADLTQRGFKNVRRWPRGIDRSKFSPQFRSETLRRKLGMGDEPILLFVGRMVGEKDLQDLADAAVILRSQGYKFRLAFAGDGPYRATMEKQLPQDYFGGFIQGQPLADLYASSDLFTFPSTTETFGNVILEAFASGLPVVGVKKGGVADLVVDGQNGFLARPKDPADIAEKIKTILDQPELHRRLSHGALQTADSYDWLTINRKLIAEGTQLANENPFRSPAPRNLPLSGAEAAKLANG